MLPNDSSKLKTPELFSDMLNALADTVAERLKATLQPSINKVINKVSGVLVTTMNQVLPVTCVPFVKNI